MATTHYRCHGLATDGVCEYTGPVDTFRSDTGSACPECGCDEAVFPYRIFRCEGCGDIGEIDELIGERTSADLDPIDDRMGPLECQCDSDHIVQIDPDDHTKIIGHLPRFE